ncbi:hypothetical protein KP79_PYT09704 [Mizuhopecten yessoensis]|uniref:39S ribosomal protein L33, mitochondrial n=1 Tax=Mizuhopecten yessoensis TaxID=6573 RepID=A0A210QCG9_MIZYE|nr:hypothetical protein KP79_PYT09704 [Mizuhopecten yessoensis]
MARKRLAKYAVVMLESLAGTGHRRVIIRMKDAQKTEQIMKDPLVGQDVLYKEIKRIRSIKVPRRT